MIVQIRQSMSEKYNLLQFNKDIFIKAYFVRPISEGPFAVHTEPALMTDVCFATICR